MNIKTELNQIQDRLAEIAKEVQTDDNSGPQSPAAQLRKASYLVSDAMDELTARAVGEVVQVAFTHNGGIGDAEPYALRRRAS
jgi:hypothetical protein